VLRSSFDSDLHRTLLGLSGVALVLQTDLARFLNSNHTNFKYEPCGFELGPIPKATSDFAYGRHVPERITLVLRLSNFERTG